MEVSVKRSPTIKHRQLSKQANGADHCVGNVLFGVRKLPQWSLTHRSRSCIMILEWSFKCKIVSYLPGGHLPPPNFGHLPPPNSDISHPPKKTFARRTTATPIFFLFFWRTFLSFFDLQLMEDIKDGKEEVLDEVVMEHIKQRVRDEKLVKEEERSAELYVSVT